MEYINREKGKQIKEKREDGRKREREPCNYILRGTVFTPSAVNVPLNQLVETEGISHRDVIESTKDASIHKITTFFTHFLTPNTRSLHNYLKGSLDTRGGAPLTWEFTVHLCHCAMWGRLFGLEAHGTSMPHFEVGHGFEPARNRHMFS